MSAFHDETRDQCVADIDPGSEWCPWCGTVRMWKGRHAAAKHSEQWEAFKQYFTRKTDTETTWEHP